MVESEEIIWSAAAVALGVTPTAGDSICASGGLSRGPAVNEMGASGSGW